MNITEAQKLELRKLLPNVADSLIASGNINDILDELHDASVDAFDGDDEPTDESRRIERLLDDIYWQNTRAN